MIDASTRIDLSKLRGERKDLLESMARELEAPDPEELTSNLRWPTRFITDIKKAPKKD